MKDLLLVLMFFMIVWQAYHDASFKDRIRQYKRILRKKNIQDTVKCSNFMDLLVNRKII